MDDTNNYASVRKITILDTTLRDGEQSPGCTLYPSEKIQFAMELEKLGVDVIEAGFAASRQTDKEIIKKICQNSQSVQIGSLSRCIKSDIDAAYDSLKQYENNRIHLFMPTSRIQVYDKMQKDYRTITHEIFESIKYANGFFNTLEFSCEDATRSELSFLKDIYSGVTQLGADVLNIPDTVGISYPEDFGRLVSEICKITSAINPTSQVSVHCHNDIDTATINSVYGILNGANQVECTINGIGERAGNCALERIIEHEKLTGKFLTNIDSTKIWPVSNLLRQFTDVKNDFAPVTGSYSFAHKAGIHQHGMSKNNGCYEIFKPELFGRKSEIIIGPHSGCHGMIAKAKELGFEISKAQAEKILLRVSEYTSREIKKNFSNEDIVKFINEL